jgi:hypothetical protein
MITVKNDNLQMALACAASVICVLLSCSSPQQSDLEGRQMPPNDVQSGIGEESAKVETEAEAARVALWFLRGRGFLQDQQVETNVVEQDDVWLVGVDDPARSYVGSGLLVEIARSGLFLRVSSSR